MAPVKNRRVFDEALLPEGKKRWGLFGAGVGLECVALIAIIVIPLLIPVKFQAAQHYWVTPLDAPVIQPYKPQPPPAPKEVVKKVEVKQPSKPEVVEVPKPRVYNTVFTAPVVKQVQKKAVNPDPIDVAKAFPTQSLGSSAIPNLKKPREAVQTGGFGDPNGVPVNNNTNRNPNIAQMGGFDMPTGPGVGNGTGGAKGAKGVVESTGFGNGVAVGGSGGGAHGAVQQGVFADEKARYRTRIRWKFSTGRSLSTPARGWLRKSRATCWCRWSSRRRARWKLYEWCGDWDTDWMRQPKRRRARSNSSRQRKAGSRWIFLPSRI
jgi:hypothetical protein